MLRGTKPAVQEVQVDEWEEDDMQKARDDVKEGEVPIANLKEARKEDSREAREDSKKRKAAGNDEKEFKRIEKQCRNGDYQNRFTRDVQESKATEFGALWDQ